MLKFITWGWFGADGFCTQLSPWFFRWVCMSVTSGLDCTVSVWTGLFHQVPNTLKLCQNLEANANRARSSSLLPFSPLWMLLMSVRHLNCCSQLLKTYWPQATMRVEVPYNCVTHWLQVQAKFLCHWCKADLTWKIWFWPTHTNNDNFIHECIFIHVGIHDVVGQVSLWLLCWPW